MQYTLNQPQMIKICSFKTIDLYSLTHWICSTAIIQLRYHNKDLSLLNRRRLPSWRLMSHAWTKTGRPWRSPWMKRRTAAPNWSLGDGPWTETSRDSSWSWMTRRPRTRWGVDPASVCAMYPYYMDPYFCEGENPTFCKGWIQLVWRGESSFCMRSGSILYVVYGHQILSSPWCCRFLIGILVPKNGKVCIFVHTLSHLFSVTNWLQNFWSLISQ